MYVYVAYKITYDARLYLLMTPWMGGNSIGTTGSRAHLKTKMTKCVAGTVPDATDTRSECKMLLHYPSHTNGELMRTNGANSY